MMPMRIFSLSLSLFLSARVHVDLCGAGLPQLILTPGAESSSFGNQNAGIEHRSLCNGPRQDAFKHTFWGCGPAPIEKRLAT